MTQARENFNKAISFIKRDGINDLVNWLEQETDFFTAPASTQFHSNYDGGLLDHTLFVARFALHNFNLLVKEKPDLEYLRESVVLCALFHDVAKTNTYVKKEKWFKDESNKWQSYQGYELDEKLPMPHGPKSAYLVSKFVKLTDSEALAMCYHMGSTDLYQPDSITKRSYDKAFTHPLVRLIHTADILAMTVEDTVDLKSNK